MMIKTFQNTLGALMTFSVWGAVAVFAVVVVFVALQLMVASGVTVYHLMNS
jgi:hypothetical protein